MTSLRTHSSLSIREGVHDVCRLDVPSGLTINVYAINPELRGSNIISTSLNPGGYIFEGYSSGFFKERGNLSVDGKLFHTEIISYVSKLGGRRPLIVRIWNMSNYLVQEYIVGKGLIAFHHEFLRLSPTTCLITKIVDFLASHIEGPARYEIMYMLGFGKSSKELFGTHDLPELIPNFNQSEYSDRFGMISYGPSMITALENLIEAYYTPFKTARNVIEFIGILEGKIPYYREYHYKHSGTYNSDNNGHTNMTLDETKQYRAIFTLLNIPFDHFEIDIDLKERFGVSISELDSMSFVYFPPLEYKEYQTIDTLCAEFSHQYFEPIYRDDNSVVYVDRVDGVKTAVDTVSIRRTMDEYLELTVVFNGGFISVRRFDLILLSLLSPVITRM